MSQAKQQGLYPRYFVLKPHGDNIYATASRKAMRIYAESIIKINPELAKDLREWADREMTSDQVASFSGRVKSRRAIRAPQKERTE